MGFLSSIDLAVEEDKCKPLIEISSSGGLSGRLAAAAEGLGGWPNVGRGAEGRTALGHFSPNISYFRYCFIPNVSPIMWDEFKPKKKKSEKNNFHGY